MLRYQTIGLLYTKTCPLACRHCIIESSPKATGKMQRSTAEAYLRTIAAYSDAVCFTGGEPLLYYTEVVELTRMAVTLGLQPSVVSGAGWVRTDKPEIARARVNGLRDAGLHKLCISWDQYHEEFAPRQQAELLASLADEAGLEVVVRSVVPTAQVGPRSNRIFGTYPAETQRLVKLGAASTLPDEQFLKLDEPPAGTCQSVLTPAVEPDGNVYACCGPGRHGKTGSPLHLGNTNEEELGVILQRGMRDPILKAILLVGPHGLYQLLKKTDRWSEIFTPRQHYSSMCDICLDLTDVPAVVDRLREKLSGLEARALMAAAELLYKQRQTNLLARTQQLASPEVHHVA